MGSELLPDTTALRLQSYEADPDKPFRDSHCAGRYFVYKSVVLCGYYYLLAYFNLDMQYKISAFLLVTPFIKLATVQLKDKRQMLIFLWWILGDSVVAFLMLYLSCWKAPWLYWVLPLSMTIACWAFELGRFLIFDRGIKSYKMPPLSTNPLDYALALVICSSYYATQSMTDWTAQPSWLDYPRWWVTQVIVDATFGVFHYYSHRVPSIWKKHKKHHQFKRDELNLLANFYAEFEDSLLMNAGVLVTAVVGPFLGGRFHLYFADTIAAAVRTHARDVDDPMLLIWNWEYDAIDRVFHKLRMSHWHQQHHRHHTQYFSVFGFVGDQVFERLLPKLKVKAEVYSN